MLPVALPSSVRCPSTSHRKASRITVVSTFSEAFPAWHAVTRHPHDRRWQLAARAGDPRVLHHALTLLDDELEAVWPLGSDAVFAVAAAVSCDTAESGPAHRALIRADAVAAHGDGMPVRVAFLRLAAVNAALEIACGFGRWGDAYDLLLCALEDRPLVTAAPGAQAEVIGWGTRLGVFLGSADPVVFEQAPHEVLRWAARAYQVGRSFGGPQDALRDAATVVLRVARSAGHTGDAEAQVLVVSAFSQLASWAMAYHDETVWQDAVTGLEALLLGGRLGPDAWAQAIVTLTTRAGEVGRVSPATWAARALPRLAELPASHRPLVLHAAGKALALDREDGVSPALLAAADAASQDAVAQAHGDRAADAIILSQHYDHVRGVVSALANRGRVSAAMRLAGRWFGARPPRQRSTLYCAPSDPRGPTYAVDGREVVLARADADAALARVTSATDAALGGSTVIRDALARGNPEVDPRALVHASGAAEFESTLRDFYQLERLGSAFARQDLAGLGLFLPHVFRHPVQALLLEVLGHVFPLVASHEEAAADRPLRRALVWTAGVQTGEAETRVAVDVLEANGVEVVDLTNRDLTPDQLLEHYIDPSYDLLWLVAHGAFNAGRPSASTIQLDWDVRHFLTLDAWAAAAVPATNGRRLLVLNLCESGIAQQSPAPPRVGFGPLLASRHQAVVGHLWSVETMAAVAFGALLVVRLSEGASYVDAFACALRALRSTSSDIATALERLGAAATDVATRLRFGRDDVLADRGVLTWGSPAFFE